MMQKRIGGCAFRFRYEERALDRHDPTVVREMQTNNA